MLSSNLNKIFLTAVIAIFSGVEVLAEFKEDLFDGDNIGIFTSDQLIEQNMIGDESEIGYHIKMEGFIDSGNKYFRLGWNTVSYNRDLRIAVINNPEGYLAKMIKVDVRIISSSNKSTETINVYSKNSPFSDTTSWDGIFYEDAALNTSFTYEFKRNLGEVQIPLVTPSPYICLYLEERRVAFNSITIVWDATSGVENVKSDMPVSDESPLYYNLQGVPVKEPSNGIFIKKQGELTTKTRF